MFWFGDHEIISFSICLKPFMLQFFCSSLFSTKISWLYLANLIGLFIFQQIDPKILDKLNSVKNFKDFVKVFNPKGYKIKKVKVPKPRPGPPTTHYELNSMKSEGLSISTRPGTYSEFDLGITNVNIRNENMLSDL